MIDITHLDRSADKNKYEVWLETDKQGLLGIFKAINESELPNAKWPVLKWPVSNPSYKNMEQVVPLGIGIPDDCDESYSDSTTVTAPSVYRHDANKQREE